MRRLGTGFGTIEERAAVLPEQYDLDSQQLSLQRSLYPLKDGGSGDINIKEAVNFTYYNVRTRLLRLIKASRSEFNCNRIFLLGGIIINTSPEFNDYVDIRDFEVLDPKKLEDPEIISILASEAFKAL